MYDVHMVLTLNGNNRENMSIELLKRESPMCSYVLKLHFLKILLFMFPVSLLFYFEEVCFFEKNANNLFSEGNATTLYHILTLETIGFQEKKRSNFNKYMLLFIHL